MTLNEITKWMSSEAEEMGVEIYAGFPVAEARFDGDTDRVVGVQTRDSGVAKDGSQKATFEPGMDVSADVTVFAEGVRGNLAKDLFRRLDVMDGRNPQTYGTGIKEIWEVSPEIGKEMHGKVMHTGGYPLDTKSYGGSWLYGIAENKISIGFVVGLDHPDARLDPHGLFVKWKQHPKIKRLLEGGKPINYGAKCVPEGGSRAAFHGTACVRGDTGGFLNAATSASTAISPGCSPPRHRNGPRCRGHVPSRPQGLPEDAYEASYRAKLYGYRNYRQAFSGGLFAGMLDFGVQMVTKGRGLVARRPGHSDHETMTPDSQSTTEAPVQRLGLHGQAHRRLPVGDDARGGSALTCSSMTPVSAWIVAPRSTATHASTSVRRPCTSGPKAPRPS